MNTNIIVVDDFYSNPDSVREYAKNLNFSIEGNYPGRRTAPESNLKVLESIFNTFQNVIPLIIKPWDYNNLGYNTAFQLTLEQDETWIHSDATDWACVVYLTPNAPVNSGTAFYSYEGKRQSFKKGAKTPKPWSNSWVKTDIISNVYNRAVIYNGLLYHRSDLPGFGDSVSNGRLFQTFFFNNA